MTMTSISEIDSHSLQSVQATSFTTETEFLELQKLPSESLVPKQVTRLQASPLTKSQDPRTRPKTWVTPAIERPTKEGQLKNFPLESLTNLVDQPR
jgi:hypothetical protein